MSGITIERVRYGQGQRENVLVLRMPDVSGIPTGRVRYYYRTCPVWPGTETKCYVLVIPDVSGIQPDVSGITGTRTLIELQLSL